MLALSHTAKRFAPLLVAATCLAGLILSGRQRARPGPSLEPRGAEA